MKNSRQHNDIIVAGESFAFRLCLKCGLLSKFSSEQRRAAAIDQCTSILGSCAELISFRKTFFHTDKRKFIKFKHKLPC